ncbi:MAG: septum formation protein Maf [Chitinophagaceae bacterium]|nr:MAG: septum formation protein Maf [Chitinophagaceae bacterium]
MNLDYPYRIVLASASPRRKMLLEQSGFKVEVRPSPAEEVIPPDYPVLEVPEYLAGLKLQPFKEMHKKGEVYIAADTVVILNNKIYGKPLSRDNAVQMLKDFSGEMHQVVSGIALLSPNGKEVRFSETTNVYFSKLTDKLIENYVDSYEPYDKAGSYAIQEAIGLLGIEKIEGCYYNVVGLPVNALNKHLQSWV